MLYDKRWELDEIGRVLWSATDYIEEHDWTQGTLCDAWGNVCAVGAIDRSGADMGQRHQAIDRLARFIWRTWRGCSPQCPSEGIVTLWNDTPGRTKDEVLAGLRGAAKSK